MTKTTTAMVAAMTAAMAMAGGGCKKTSDADKGKGTSGGAAVGSAGGAGGSGSASVAAPGSGSAPAAVATEGASVALDAGTAFVEVPVQWTRAPFGTGAIFSAPNAGIFPSTITVGMDCLGLCSSIADNLAAAAAKQIEMHKGSGYDATLVGEAKLDGEGLLYELKVTKGDQAFTQVFRYLWKAGQGKAISCMATAMKPELEAPLRNACTTLKVSMGASAPTPGAAAGSSTSAEGSSAASADAASAGSAAAAAPSGAGSSTP